MLKNSVIKGYCDHQQLIKMFRRFYPGASEELSIQFADKVTELETPVSAADIQGFFMFAKDSPQAAIDNVSRLKV